MKWSLYRTFVCFLGAFLALQFLLCSWHSDRNSALGVRGRLSLSLPVTATKIGRIPRGGHVNLQTSEGEGDKKELTHNPICSLVPRGSLAVDLWHRGQRHIIQALRHPRDAQGIHSNWTTELLNLLSPHVLEYAIKGFPSRDTLRPLFNILSQRFEDTSTVSSLESSTLLKIVVLGGSIVEGTGCTRSPVPGGGKIDFQSLQECAWPFRLEHALNFFISKWFPSIPRIHIHNLAAGGTNSEAAIPILRYWLSPVFHPNGADVVVNAYSANDNLPPAFHATTNTTIDSYHLARILKRNLQFIQAARDINNHQVHCHDFYRPMILYVNDYVGNQQESIIGDGQLDQAIQWLTDVEATMGYVSVSHSVRRWVWADTSEEFFSPPWLDRKGRPTINVHYGMGGHVTTTIAILYFFLRLILDFCDDYIENDDDVTESLPTSSFSIYHSSEILLEDYVQIDIPTKEWIQEHQPSLIRPNLTQWDWRRSPSTSDSSRTSASTKCDNQSSLPPRLISPCAFAFLAAPLGTHQRQDLLVEFLKPFTIQQDGWMVQNDFRQGGFQNKLGLVAVKPGATMTLGMDPMSSTTIRVVTVHYLKSYGDLWRNSRVEFRGQVILEDTVIHEDEWSLEGFHEQSVSISYSHQVKLTQPIPGNASFQLHMRLVSGHSFKINALMLCSR